MVGAVGSGSSFLWILLSPQRQLREMPEPIEDELRTEAEAAGRLSPIRSTRRRAA